MSINWDIYIYVVDNFYQYHIEHDFAELARAICHIEQWQCNIQYMYMHDEHSLEPASLPPRANSFILCTEDQWPKGESLEGIGHVLYIDDISWTWF